MSRALVTGATGFIGGHLVRTLLDQGWSVRCLARPSPRADRLQARGVQIVHADLSRAEDLSSAARDCQVVFHLAAKTSALTRDELYRTNVAGSFAVARACAAQATPPTLVVVSSIAAMGTAVAGRRRLDQDRPRPVSEYGRSKRGGELAAAAWADRVPISVVRPSIVFGPGNREMLPMFQSITRFQVHAVPGYTPRRVALIHVDDLTEILLSVARGGQRLQTAGPLARPGDPSTSQGCYLATADDFPTYPQLGRMIARATGTRRVMILPVAEPFAWMAALGSQAWGRLNRSSGSFNPDKLREAFAGDWTGGSSRLADEFGFQPRQPLQQRLQETAEWYRREGWI